MSASTGVPGPEVLESSLRDRLAAARLWLVSTASPTTCGNLPYLATAVYALVPVATRRVEAMTVDPYWRAYVHPDWLARTDIPEVAARIAHLVWHLLVEHADRARDLQVTPASAEAWRTAADLGVAVMLDDPNLPTGLASPTGLGLPTGRSAEEYYARLSRLPASGSLPGSDPGSDPGGESRPDPGEGRHPDPGCGSGCDGLPRWYDLPPGDPVGGLGETDAAEVRRRVAIEFREHQRSWGSVPGQWSRWVDHVLDPVVPWTQVLAAAVRRGAGWVHGNADYTYTRISRRQSAAGAVILPATRRPAPEVAVVVDTSASVDDGLLAQALGEVDGVLAGLGVAGGSVTVLAVDVAVQAVSRVRSGRHVTLGGGGGTDMGAGIAAAMASRPRPSILIVLTDGHTPWPQRPPPLPVIAAVVGRSHGDLPPTPEWVHRVECVLDERTRR